MLDPQNLYISEGTLTELEALYLRHSNDPLLLPTVIERLPKTVLRYIHVLERRVNARTQLERDFFDNVYRQLKQAMIDIPRARNILLITFPRSTETGENLWKVFLHYFLVVHLTDQVVSFVADRLLDEPTVTRWTSDGVSYLAYL
ncbi:hypothetical protein BZA05DRAFT_421367 [Tricharina praecox]|uniref:uncharacterized protein n=1 Tax=Tricharina praecox TaxID=43433 RepID=UPI00222048D2|nr:uncharacterized protein BZA05DRAFT_421367 [Tricharina praecox]KAI5845538.1 hypothetical protein BZA05DRAFT_421367 [Tricharina praecox]